MSSDGPGFLATARYGKDKVRVFRTVRGTDGVHTIVEYIVTALLEGALDVSYTQADNSVVVATDSNLAKTSPHVLSPARFAVHLGTHLVSKYVHLTKAVVTVQQLRWARIGVDGAAHPHAFWRDGDEKRIVTAVVDKTADGAVATVEGGLKDLLVLKSTGSAFENFVRDEYTTLVEVNDRIFSTAVDLAYTYAPLAIAGHGDGKELDVKHVATKSGDAWDDDQVATKAREITLKVFATDDSASVQATLYKMGQEILAANPAVMSVQISLPNKHYIPVDMKYIGLDNTTPSKAEVFVPVDAPSGLITASVARA
ncbi:uricase [Vararia minispora EC-137]|uniref:Uricase n=1 Tax=Vararia minispora EC-137 TaxID=1314806 RepID=A0ACB8QHN1_9AGAM|nr:uricase [Vararia minispora EC-137]